MRVTCTRCGRKVGSYVHIGPDHTMPVCDACAGVPARNKQLTPKNKGM